MAAISSPKWNNGELPFQNPFCLSNLDFFKRIAHDLCRTERGMIARMGGLYVVKMMVVDGVLFPGKCQIVLSCSSLFRLHLV